MGTAAGGQAIYFEAFRCRRERANRKVAAHICIDRTAQRLPKLAQGRGFVLIDKRVVRAASRVLVPHRNR